MTGQNFSNIKELQSHEIKNLIQNHGKANIDGKEWKLHNPDHNDTTLQTIIQDPKLSTKLLGSPSHEGEFNYELHGNGKSVNIKIKLQTHHHQG